MPKTKKKKTGYHKNSKNETKSFFILPRTNFKKKNKTIKDKYGSHNIVTISNALKKIHTHTYTNTIYTPNTHLNKEEF